MFADETKSLSPSSPTLLSPRCLENINRENPNLFSPPCSSSSEQRLIDSMGLAPATARPQEFDTPIHLLPMELVAGIFTICHETEDLNDSPTGCARVIISHVCSRWRAIILSIPTLWCTISIRGPRGSTKPRLEAHLERSAMCPLSLHFVSNISTAQHSVEQIKDYMVLTIVHAQRWKSVQLDLTYEHAPPILDVLNSTSFPSLEILNVNVLDWPQAPSNALFDIFSSYSGIRKLSWRGSVGTPPSSFLAALTHFEIGPSLSLRQLYTLLSQCCHVSELRISTTRDSGEGPLHDTAVITLDKLEVLSVFTNEPFEEVFDRVCLPRLRQLEIRFLGNFPAPGRPSRGLDTFLVRSKCALQEFLLRDKYIPSEALIQLLHMPNLETVRDLSIDVPSLDDRVLATLTRPVDGEGILPRLQTSSFWRLQSSDGTLGDMMVSRVQGVGQHLKRMRTTLPGFFPKDMHALKSLEAQGMHTEYG
ncbi:hypothetical protein HGRIS_000802 [Hohenbuehelia grisea]|uniref:F-box domain-containing protein n=1 Tax=Hohenbuehelia grisea TaxID=104357 RepID=A0ABR3IPU0_9AGAR